MAFLHRRLSLCLLTQLINNSMVEHEKMKSSQGFTLIEIMVAVAILALSGVALLGNIGQATRDLSVLNDKVEALHIAEYTLNGVLLQQDFPELANEEEVVTHAGREWRVELSVSETTNEKMRRIDVMVQPHDKRIGSIQTATILLSGFRGDIY